MPVHTHTHTPPHTHTHMRLMHMHTHMHLLTYIATVCYFSVLHVVFKFPVWTDMYPFFPDMLTWSFSSTTTVFYFHVIVLWNRNKWTGGVICPRWGVWRIWAKPFQWIGTVIWTQHSDTGSEQTTGPQHWFLFIAPHSVPAAHLCSQSSGMAYSEVWKRERGCNYFVVCCYFYSFIASFTANLNVSASGSKHTFN